MNISCIVSFFDLGNHTIKKILKYVTQQICFKLVKNKLKNEDRNVF